MTAEMLFMASANFLVCSGIGFICVCRLNAMDGAVLIRVRSEYASYLAGATYSGFSFTVGQWPEEAALAMASALFIGLMCSQHAWRRDIAPASASFAPVGMVGEAWRTVLRTARSRIERVRSRNRSKGSS